MVGFQSYRRPGQGGRELSSSPGPEDERTVVNLVADRENIKVVVYANSQPPDRYTL